ncbi:MAG: DegT/DnrJ/EryC1/StrS family aminotransferase [bacterium]|nr:DegT/DnrJ/EryC1/StrS family aminotransferase [bacterium]
MIITPVHFPTLRIHQSPDEDDPVDAPLTVPFASGTAALRAGLAACARQRGCGILRLLVPSYICREPMDALAADGIALRYYPVRESLEPDWEALDAQAGDADAFLLVHYFSYPNAAAQARAWCAARNIAFIEDCAHVMERGSGMGELGLFACFSPWKFFPIPRLGTLVTEDTAFASYVPDIPLARHRLRYARWYGKRSVQRVLTAAGIRWYARTTVDTPQAVAHEAMAADRDVLAHTRRYASARTWIRQRRQENAQAIHSFVRGRRPDVLVRQSVPEGIAPYALPIIWPQPAADVVAVLRRRGIPATLWPTLPDVVRHDARSFPVAHRYAACCVLLPVHEHIRPRHLAYMLRMLATVL